MLHSHQRHWSAQAEITRTRQLDGKTLHAVLTDDGGRFLLLITGREKGKLPDVLEKRHFSNLKSAESVFNLKTTRRERSSQDRQERR